MKVVIDIDEKDYEFIKSVKRIMKNSDTFQRIATDLFNAVQDAGVSEVRLVDANALKKAIYNDLGLGDEENGSDAEYMSGLQDCYNLIDNAPTVCGNNPKWCESCISKGKCVSTRPLVIPADSGVD